MYTQPHAHTHTHTNTNTHTNTYAYSLRPHTSIAEDVSFDSQRLQQAAGKIQRCGDPRSEKQIT